MDRMDVAMSELSIQQNIVFSRLEDLEDDMNVSLGVRGGVLTQCITNTLQGNGQRT
jgi:hypothetical protein